MLIFILTAALVRGNCPTSGASTFVANSWYTPLTLCALRGGVSTPSELTTCLISVGNVFSVQSSPELRAGLNRSVSSLLPCYACVFEYAKSASELFASNPFLVYDCWDSDAADLTTISTAACQWRLVNQIEAFNQCSGNGYNLVSGAVSTRCSKDEFYEFALKHNPVAAIAECAHDVLNNTVLKVTRCVTSARFLADYNALSCKGCLDTFIGSVITFASTCVSSGSFSLNACMAGMVATMEVLKSCTGGMAFNIEVDTPCSVSDARIIEAMRPYGAIMSCAFEPVFHSRRLLEDLDGAGRFTRVCRRLEERRLTNSNLSDCMQYYTLVRDAVSLNCQAYLLENFLYDAAVFHNENVECREDIFSERCIDAQNSLYSPVYEFEVRSGVMVDTSTTVSRSNENISYIPALRCALRSGSVDETLDCIEAMMDGSTCIKKMAIEAFLTRGTIVDLLCMDMFAESCLEAMALPLTNFKVCYGFNAKSMSFDACSSDETSRDSLAMALSLVSSVVNSTEAMLKFDQWNTLVGANCGYCHEDLIVDLFDMDDPSVCIENFTSWACYMAGGPLIDKYWKCTREWSSDMVAERDPFIPLGYWC